MLFFTRLLSNFWAWELIQRDLLFQWESHWLEQYIFHKVLSILNFFIIIIIISKLVANGSRD